MDLTETKQSIFREDGDDLEKAYREVIEAEIPEYIRFWKEYIGVREREPREPYRLLPQANVTESLINWH